MLQGPSILAAVMAAMGEYRAASEAKPDELPTVPDGVCGAADVDEEETSRACATDGEPAGGVAVDEAPEAEAALDEELPPPPPSPSNRPMTLPLGPALPELPPSATVPEALAAEEEEAETLLLSPDMVVYFFCCFEEELVPVAPPLPPVADEEGVVMPGMVRVC